MFVKGWRSVSRRSEWRRRAIYVAGSVPRKDLSCLFRRVGLTVAALLEAEFKAIAIVFAVLNSQSS